MNYPAKPLPSFNLMRWFSVLSLVSIVVTSSLTALVLARYYARDALQRDSALTMEFVGAIVAAANARHAHEASSGDGFRMSAIEHYMAGHGHTLRGHQHKSDAGLREHFEVLAGMQDVLRVIIYASDRSTVWSSEKTLIGETFHDNDELEQAFTGVPVVHEAVAGSGDKIEHTILPEPGQRYVEHYLPIWNSDKSRVAGVIELYKSPRSLFNAIDRGRRIVWLSTALGGGALYLALFWIVRCAGWTMRSQQERLVESETMATIGAMSGIIAHNIRNPLASIRSSAELALEVDSLESAHDAASDTIAEADRMEYLLHELLSFSRQGPSENSSVSLPRLIDRCVQRAAGAAATKNIVLEVDLSGDLPPVEGDESLLGQALANIINNAIEATPEGGRVGISARPQPGAGIIAVQVDDTGCGLAADQLEQVFKPFVTTKNRGLGLGLPLTRRLLQRMGGAIELSSTLAQGTTVNIELAVSRR
ncbi:MAG: two-component system sensor histidine kinase NtrB [Gammaproteobacteria bacterium]